MGYVLEGRKGQWGSAVPVHCRMVSKAGAVPKMLWPEKGQTECGAGMARSWDCLNASCSGVIGCCHLSCPLCLHLPWVKLGQQVFIFHPLGYLSCRFISTFLQCAPRSSWAMSPLCSEVLVKARGCEVAVGVGGLSESC